MSTSSRKNLAEVLVDKKYWWAHLLIVAGIGAAGLIYLGGATYTGASPHEYFTSSTWETVISSQQIKR